MNHTRARRHALVAAAAAALVGFTGCSHLSSDGRPAAEMLQDKAAQGVPRGSVRPTELRPFPVDARNRPYATVDDQAERPRSSGAARVLQEPKAER
jgi:hypothetical protein